MTRLSNRQKRVHDFLLTGKYSAADITIALGYCDPRSYIRDLKDKGVIIQDEWIDAGDGVRFKRHWIANEHLHSNIPGIRAVGEVMQTNFKNLFEKRRQDD